MIVRVRMMNKKHEANSTICDYKSWCAKRSFILIGSKGKHKKKVKTNVLPFILLLGSRIINMEYYCILDNPYLTFWMVCGIESQMSEHFTSVLSDAVQWKCRRKSTKKSYKSFGWLGFSISSCEVGFGPMYLICYTLCLYLYVAYCI